MAIRILTSLECEEEMNVHGLLKTALMQRGEALGMLGEEMLAGRDLDRAKGGQ